MNPSALQPVRWSTRRWTGTIVGLFAAQLALLLYFGERSHLLPRALRSGTQLHFAADPLSTKQLTEQATTDPAIFALPSPHGFSGSGWLNYHEPDYKPQKWTEPPVFLALDPSQLTGFESNVQGDQLAAFLVSTRLLRSTVDQIAVPPLPLADRSTLELQGAIRERRLLKSARLPAWYADDLLTNTVVEVVVGGDGRTRTARVLASSNSRAADDFALETAAAAIFAPIGSGPEIADRYEFGRMVFNWQTLPQLLTNSVSSTR